MGETPRSIAREMVRQGVRGEFRGIGAMALALMGREALAYGDRDQLPPWVFNPERRCIRLRRDLTNEEVTQAIANGLATWWCDRQRFALTAPEIEMVARMITIPDEPLREAIAELGKDVTAIAARFVCFPAVASARLWNTAPPNRSGVHRLKTAS